MEERQHGGIHPHLSLTLTEGIVMEHDQTAADRSQCYCETCTDLAAWYGQDN